MTGVGSLHQRDLRRRKLHRPGKLHGPAIEWPVPDRQSGPERLQHFGQKPLMVHVSAGKGISLWGPLLRAQEEIVHMYDGPSKLAPHLSGEGGLSGGAGTVQCQNDTVPIQAGNKSRQFLCGDPLSHWG